MALAELAPGLLWWTARHPEWHPAGFGDEVGSYHVRGAGRLWKRWHADVPVTIHGPPHAARRLDGRAAAAFEELEPGTPGPAGVEAFAIGRPRRGERPLWLPSHASLAFGDAVVTTPDGDVRMWAQEPLDDRRLAFYRDRFAPTLEPLLDLPLRRVLVTHGAPVLDDGAAALRDAIHARPWSPHG